VACQALPEPPLELIERWQGYLTKSRDVCNCCARYTDEELERNWQEYWGNIPPLDEEYEIQRLVHLVEDLEWPIGGSGWLASELADL
jgi:hypothetical protein